MPEAPRLEVEGGIHHVTNRGTRKTAIFVDDHDRWWFLRRLDRVAERRDWCCLAYCLMTNHVHLVIETRRPTLGAGMRDLLSHYARVFNERHGLKGTTFEARFGSRLVTTEQHFAQTLRYVALNPVKAGLVAAPEDYRWSSHAALLSGRFDPCGDGRRVAELLDAWGGEPHRRYSRLFEPDHPLARHYGDKAPWEHRPPLTELLGGPHDLARLQRAREHGYRLAEIAAALGLHEATVSRRLRHARNDS
jgi:REP element-mobilizing transposase RayT